VHVAGAVAAPGVYELAAGSRVDGAIAAAGGPTPEANPNALNLAAPLVDGSRIHVPLIGEDVPSPVVTVGTTIAGEAPGSTIVDVNSATSTELETLPGVGPATALAIVTERDRNGPYLSVDDLDRVPGIGPAKIEAFRDLVTT
jgi:competence protein ComEA